MTRPTRTTDRHLDRAPTRGRRRLAAVAFVLALATVAFAATVASLASLALPVPAAPTATTIYVPAPAGPPPASWGGGR
jgi:hypothetical protein